MITPKKHLIVKLPVNGRQLRFLVDSGATHTLIKNRPSLAIQPTDVKLCSMTGHQIPVIGSTQIEIRKKKLRCTARMIVIDETTDISVDGILGNEFFTANNCKIDYSKNHLQIGRTNLPFEPNVTFTKEKICAINKISGAKPVPLFSFSNEIFLAAVEEASTIDPFHEQIIFVKLKNIKPDGEPPTPGRLVVSEKQCKTKNGKAPLMVASGIANLSDGSDPSVIPMKVANISAAPLVLNKGRVLTNASYVSPEFEASLEKSKSLPPESVNVISKADKPPIQLKDFQIDESNEHVKEQVKDLLNEFRQIVALPGEKPGVSTVMTHKIRLEDETPVYKPQYRIPHVHQAALDKEVEQMRADNVISPSKSPYNSPLVVVPKKDGSLRLCVDFRGLNKKIIADRFPLPVMSEVLQNLANSDTFTTLDCMAGFWQIALDENSKEKTAFSTREGHFHFNVLPFGLKDAANSFERAAMSALADLVGNTVLVYLDDLIICSKGTEEHFRKLRKVLEKLRAANFTLKLSKCELFRSELSFLGHRVSKDGLSVEESKKVAIKNCETPKDKEALRSFLGLMGFYRNFVPRFSHTAEPLLKLLRKSSKFIWEDEQENAYQQLKAALLEPPILKYPDYSKTFFVVTDASQVGLGASLMQEWDGRLHPIAYASRTLNTAERNYSTTKREALAVVWALRHFRFQILGYELVVLTDHKPLLTLFMKNPPDAIMARWFLLIQEFHPHVRHIPGKTNILADLLSRAGCPADAVKSEIPEDEILVESLCAIEATLTKNNENTLYVNSPFQIAELVNAQDNDHRLAPIKRALTNIRTKDNLPSGLSSFFLEDDVLHKTTVMSRLGKTMRLALVCIPDKLVRAACNSIHVHSAHAAVERAVFEAERLIYHPELKAEMKKVIQECKNCCQTKNKLKEPFLYFHPVPSSPFQEVSLDFLGPLPVGSTGCRYILVMVDTLTRYIIAVPTIDRTAETVISSLQKHLFCPFDVPKSMRMDNAKEFRSELLKNITSAYGMRLSFSTPYHPQGNGIAEASVKKVLKALRLFCTEKDSKTWDLVIYDAISFINASYNASIGDSPFFALFGRDRNHPLRLLEAYGNYNENVVASKNQMKEMDDFLQNHVNDATAMKIIGQNRKRQQLQFRIGERVYVPKNLIPENSQNKLEPLFNGPFEIMAAKPPASYVIRHLTTNKERVLHGSKLLPAGKTFLDPELTPDNANTDQKNDPVEKRPKRKWNKQIVPPSDRQLRPRT